MLDALCLGKVGEFADFGALCDDADAVAAVAKTPAAWRLVLLIEGAAVAIASRAASLSEVASDGAAWESFSESPSFDKAMDSAPEGAAVAALCAIAGVDAAQSAGDVDAEAAATMAADDACLRILRNAPSSFPVLCKVPEVVAGLVRGGGLSEKQLSSALIADAAAGYLSESFADEPWSVIADIAKLAKASPSSFEGYVGKKVNVALDGLGTFGFAVAAVGSPSGTGLTFCCSEAVAEYRAHTITTETTSAQKAAVNWGNCDMRDYMASTLIEKFPADARSAMATVVHAAGDSAADDKLWLPSLAEVGLVSGHDGFPLFSGDASRIRKRNGTAKVWWLRDRPGGDRLFASVNSSGGRYTTSGGSANNLCGIVPCFSL